MSETKQPATPEVIAKRAPGFQPEHPRFGGKRKRTAQMARDLAEKLGCDPLEFLLKVVHADVYVQTVIGPDGKKQKKEVVIDLATRIDAAKACVAHFYPKLNSTAVTGPEDGPIETVHLDLTKLLSDPAAVEMAQKLALMVAQDADADEAEVPRPRPYPGDTYLRK